MKILVTGGSGFTGSHLTRRLIKKGHKVVVLDHQEGRFLKHLKEIGAEVVLGSVADRDLVMKVVEGCEVVHHVAAAFRKVNLPKQIYWDVNVSGTRYLLEAAVAHGVRKFINCSTCGVHGDVKNGPAREESAINPADYYQYTKYEAEKVVKEFIGKGPDLVTLRPAAIYGPGDPERFLMLFRMVKRGRFLMFGNGNSHYHPLYIDNLIDAFELAAESKKGAGEVYLIADEHYYTLNDLVTAIGKVLKINLKILHLPFAPLWLAALLCEVAYKPLPAEPPLFRRRVDWYRQNRAFSIEKARKDLGYNPRVGLEEGLAKTAEWYVSEGLI